MNHIDHFLFSDKIYTTRRTRIRENGVDITITMYELKFSFCVKKTRNIEHWRLLEVGADGSRSDAWTKTRSRVFITGDLVLRVSTSLTHSLKSVWNCDSKNTLIKYLVF